MLKRFSKLILWAACSFVFICLLFMVGKQIVDVRYPTYKYNFADFQVVMVGMFVVVGALIVSYVAIYILYWLFTGRHIPPFSTFNK